MSLDAHHYYQELAGAFCRGRLHLDTRVSTADAIKAGLDADLRLHKFKRNAELPRVRRVLGMLRAFAVESLFDVGSGRGVFLFPALDELPWVSVTAIDHDHHRARDLCALAEGGVDQLCALRADVRSLPASDHSHDVVTMLEVLEHLEAPRAAVVEALRIARRAVIASVPSKEDDNPQHVQLFDTGRLEELFLDSGARSVTVDSVRGHFIAVAKVA